MDYDVSYSQANVVWISCSGENPADNENIGAIQYIPRRGFPGFYFPYVNTPNYQPPVVAILFEGPKSKCSSTSVCHMQ